MNYIAIFTCAIISMILGGLWYGPLFGKSWMSITGAAMPDTPEKMREMQKKIWPLYLIQFLLSLFQISVLSLYINAAPGFTGVENALLICLAFVVPTSAGSVMWDNYTLKTALEKFLIQLGYQLVLFIIFGAILGLGR